MAVGTVIVCTVIVIFDEVDQVLVTVAAVPQFDRDRELVGFGNFFERLQVVGSGLEGKVLPRAIRSPGAQGDFRG